MLVNTLVCLFCTFLSKQVIILSVGYKWSNCFPSASSRVDQINSDSLAVQISTARDKRVKRHYLLTFGQPCGPFSSNEVINQDMIRYLAPTTKSATGN